MARMKARDEDSGAQGQQGPSINQDQLGALQKEKADYDAKALLQSYWRFVKDVYLDSLVATLHGKKSPKKFKKISRKKYQKKNIKKKI
jgi:hypothetical protein